LSLNDVQLHLVTTVDEAQELLRWLSERHESNTIGFDIETGEYPGKDPKHALSPYHGRIRLAQIGDEHHGWALAWDEWAGLFYEAMSKWEGDIVCHNIAFEASWMANQSRWKFPWERAHDTMLGAKVLDPSGSGALKQLTAKYIDKRAAALQNILEDTFSNNGWSWGTIPVDNPNYWQYGALDPVITVQLLNHQKNEGLISRYGRVYELEMAARKVVSKMEQNGAPIDVEYSEAMYKKLSDEVNQAKSWCKENVGVNIGSSAQLAKFFTKMGATITKTTKGGNPSVDKDQLKFWAVSGENESIKQYAKLILDVKKKDKIATAYFDNFVKMHVDGVLHPQIKTMGARTGRMSCVTPALQTIPRGDELVRGAFIPSPGGKIVTADMDQVEARLLAHFANEQGLADAFASPEDFFTVLTRQIFNDPSIVKEDKRRSLTKNTVYARLYGAGLTKMANTAGVSEEQMKSVVDAFDETYPGVTEFQNRVTAEVEERFKTEGQGYVLTPFGRRIPCDDDKPYTGVNYTIQAHAAELMKESLVRADAAGLSEYLTLPIHDEILLNVPDAEANDALRVLQECMEVVDGTYLVPLTAGADGPYENWGVKYASKTVPLIEEDHFEETK
jgi:DNA polymerase I